MNVLTSRTRFVLISFALTILSACGGGGESTTNSPKGNEPIKATAITISPQITMVRVGEPVQLTAVITPDNATNKGVSWSSSDTATISVSATGLVTANAASGSATITATALDGSQIRGSITVRAVANDQPIPVTAITVSPQNPSVRIGTPAPLTALITPANATNKGVTWSSSDTATISVSDTGLVTANAESGSATITATAQDGSGIRGSTTVTAAPQGPIRVTAITLSPQGPSVVRGGTPVQLTALITPGNAANQAVTWSSSDNAIISVSSTGLLTANAESGSATITATAQDGSGIRGSTTATAVANNQAIKVTAITLSPQNPWVVKGEKSVKLTAVISPADAVNKDITWTSSDNATVSVSTEGIVTANVDSGSVTITATAQDGSGIRGSTTVIAVPPCSTATPCLHVTSDASSNGDGSSWTSPFLGLQAALEQAKTLLARESDKPSTVRIFLKNGTYRPSKKAGDTACDANASSSDCTFVMQNNVEIYGGFAGTETSLADRVLNNAPTTTYLDGLLNPSTSVTACSTDTVNVKCSLNVINNTYDESAPLTASAILDGVVVRNARNPRGNGGGMYNYSASPTIRNVIFSGNIASAGGGMYNQYSSLTLTNVTFSGNTATASGGGLYNRGDGLDNSTSFLSLTNVTFSSNSAAIDGGGMENYGSQLLLTNVTFSGNAAGQGGGGLANSNSPFLLLTNVTFFGNRGGTVGAKNLANSSAKTLIINTLLWGDGIWDPAWDDFIQNGNGSRYTVYSSLIQGKAADQNGNLNGVTATTAGIFGTATLADNGNPLVQTVAIAANSPAVNNGSLVWQSGTDYYASTSSNVFKLTGTGTGKINALPVGATLISTGGANKNNTVTPTADPPAIYPDIGAYQH